MRLLLNFIKHAQIPICNVDFNDSIPSKLLFDSGHSGGVIAQMDSVTGQVQAAMHSDIWCYHPDSSDMCQKLSAIHNSSILSITDQCTGLLVNGVSINGLNMTLFLRYTAGDKNSTNIDGYITSAFIKRFDAMYYNPFEHQIILYT